MFTDIGGATLPRRPPSHGMDAFQKVSQPKRTPTPAGRHAWPAAAVKARKPGNQRVHVHPCCRLKPERLNLRPLFRKPSMSSGNQIKRAQPSQRSRRRGKPSKLLRTSKNCFASHSSCHPVSEVVCMSSRSSRILLDPSRRSPRIFAQLIALISMNCSESVALFSAHLTEVITNNITKNAKFITSIFNCPINPSDSPSTFDAACPALPLVSPTFPVLPNVLPWIL